MFIHSQVVRSRVFALALLVPVSVLAWLLSSVLEAGNTTAAGTVLVGVLTLCVAAMLFACVLLWVKAAEIGQQRKLPDPEHWTGPNHIEPSTRFAYVLGSCVLLAYGVYALLVDDFYLPGKRGSGMHFHGRSAWLMFGSICCVVINLVSMVVDHYDRRNNELMYAHVATAAEWFAWTFFAAALLSQFLSG